MCKTFRQVVALLHGAVVPLLEFILEFIMILGGKWTQKFSNLLEIGKIKARERKQG
jgi:hypothetical protein